MYNKNICFTQILFSYFVTRVIVVLSHFFLFYQVKKWTHSEKKIWNEISIAENFLEQNIFSRFWTTDDNVVPSKLLYNEFFIIFFHFYFKIKNNKTENYFQRGKVNFLLVYLNGNFFIYNNFVSSSKVKNYN